ncbi:MAG: hypothetical protein LBI43_07205 [Streptococcaceae bacterium]|jgi:lysozyme|nr:hypothetical protein [Streptococcaceae bacterium]
MASRKQRTKSFHVRGKINARRLGLTLLGIVAVLALIFAFRAYKAANDLANGKPFDHLPALRSDLQKGKVNLQKPIIDLSAFQPHTAINYDQLASQVSGVIVRVQHGTKQTPSSTINSDGSDTQFKYHITQFQARGIPVAVYAYVDGNSISAMKAQAKAFFKNASPYQPTFYWLDAETLSMKDINDGLVAYRDELISLGVPASRIGIYSNVAFFVENGIETSNFATSWVASYGLDNGSFSGKAATTFPFALQQYTSKGNLEGYSGNLDLSRASSQAAYAQIFLGKSS